MQDTGPPVFEVFCLKESPAAETVAHRCPEARRRTSDGKTGRQGAAR